MARIDLAKHQPGWRHGQRAVRKIIVNGLQTHGVLSLLILEFCLMLLAKSGCSALKSLTK